MKEYEFWLTKKNTDYLGKTAYEADREHWSDDNHEDHMNKTDDRISALLDKLKKASDQIRENQATRNGIYTITCYDGCTFTVEADNIITPCLDLNFWIFNKGVKTRLIIASGSIYSIKDETVVQSVEADADSIGDDMNEMPPF